MVVSGERSASGGALVASDPHLGLQQPNFWCVVGVRAPGLNAVGLSTPGLPFVLVGRNERAAWTGTNMQSSSSVLYRLPEGWRTVETRAERIGVRWWFDDVVPIRESAFGPVLTDATLMRRLGEGDLAFRWRGHEPSDEASTFLSLMTVSDWPGFRAAFATYAVGGQNMLFGDASGAIGQVMALEAVEAAGRAARDVPVPADDERFVWKPGLPGTELPAAFNPASGVLVSANNTPARAEPALVPQGNANDRVRRMRALLAGDDEVTLDRLAALQQDTYSPASHETARSIVQRVDGSSLGVRAQGLVRVLASWDGRYDASSRGAVAYEAALDRLIERLYARRYGEKVRRAMRSGPYVHDFVREDVERADAEAITRALEEAARAWTPATTWEEIHRLRLAHPIANVPVLGRAYRFDEVGWPGSTTTLSKSAHAVSGGEHTVFLGANARMLMDVGTLDDNRVVLVGGQDGWLGSDRLLDQLTVWREGAYVPLPMTEAAQDARAVRRSRLRPGGD